MILLTRRICQLGVVGVTLSSTIVCWGGEAEFLQGVPLPAPSTSQSAARFHRLPPESTGIKLVHEFPASGSFELLQDHGGGIGVGIGDFDGDGLPDIFVTHYDQGNHLYRNLGQCRFEDITSRAGVSAVGRWCSGVTVADVDNDGDLDVFVAVFNGPNLMFINRGNATFEERAMELGLTFSGASVSMAFADFDHDGLLDGYLLTHRLAVGADAKLPRGSKEGFSRGVLEVGENRQLRINDRFSELFEIMSKGAGRLELIIAGQSDHVYRGGTGGRFTETTQTSGVRGHEIGLAVTGWDYNGDGWEDLYISNDYKGADRLYRNNRDGTFTDVASTTLPHVPWSSMGSDAADINNDGWMDFIATDMSGSSPERRKVIHSDPGERWFLKVADPHQYPRNAVYIGTGTANLMEVSYLTGLANTDWTWSPKWADFDNDGWVDLFVANGMARDFVNSDLLAKMKDRVNRNWLQMPVLKERNLAFRNRGDLSFDDVSEAWGLDSPTASYGAAVADLDRDGDLDLIVTNFDEPMAIYRNDSPPRHRLLLRLKGTRSNRWGLGAVVHFETEAGTQTRSVSSTSGFLSSNEPLIHVGLGSATNITRMSVLWPSGIHQSFTNVSADQWLTLVEAGQAPAVIPELPSRPTWFRERSLATSGLVHQPQEFDDFVREPLLPWKLSQFGPGLAVGDADGDGVMDWFLSGASGQSGMLAITQTNGPVQVSSLSPPVGGEAAESLGALFFDADSDGDLDLYVVSGGVESGAEEASLNDRLYLNDGRGHFNLAPEGTLPRDQAAGSIVAAADFDRDGDLDLFVGGRSLPGRYGKPGKSLLLRNDSGRFSDVAATSANGLSDIGMATSAIWSDVNGDGWIDLLVTREWGPVELFLNERGKLVLNTTNAGLASWRGFWNGISAGDVDHDGDIDFVASNLGLNTSYAATQSRPLLAYLGEFGGEGSAQLIETEYSRDRLVPRRSKGALAAVLPGLMSRYRSFADYSKATVEELLGSDRLRTAQEFSVTTLESGLFRNDGHGLFTFEPLPRVAQVAPAFGVALTDVDGDGNLDLFLVHNFSGPQPEVGAMDGGLSLLLAGNPHGEFSAIPPRESGLVVKGDARALSVVDVNQDGRPDFLVSVNHGAVRAFENQTSIKNRFLKVRLKGGKGNRDGIGARVTLVLTQGPPQIQEIYAGGGYLSQSTPELFFGLGPYQVVDHIEVRWPSGRSTITRSGLTGTSVVLDEDASSDRVDPLGR